MLLMFCAELCPSLSISNSVLELSNLLVSMHDTLLQNRFLTAQLKDLLLHVLVLSVLLLDGHLKVLEVLHDVGVNYFDIFIVLRRQVILHQADLLTKKFNLFLVLAEHLLRGFDPIFDALDVRSYAVFIGALQLGSVSSSSFSGQKHLKK